MKKYRVIRIMMCMAFAAVLGAWIFGSGEAQAASKASLVKEVRAKAKKPILKTYYADYDGDGSRELFAITGKKESENAVWYAGNKGVRKVVKEEISAYYPGKKGIYDVGGKQKLFIMEFGGYGSGSRSVCFYVKDGEAWEVKQSLEGLRQISGREFAIYPSAFDNGKTDGIMDGHTWKPYYLKWTGKKFKEYQAKKISVSALKKYRGGKEIVKKIKKTGYKIKSVYYRSNGIIHVNVVYRVEKGNFSYENVNLSVKKNKVSLLVSYRSGNNIVEKSSHGGTYRRVSGRL